MWPFRKKKPESIHVRFFDIETGKQFAASDLPVGQLPQSFEAQTTLHIREQDWTVQEARPMTAAEFIASGKLTLILRKANIQTIDPRNVLYSLPTIANELPPIAAGSSKLHRDVLETHEDDYRQVEWVAESFGETIELEFTKIQTILDEERQGVGFKTLRVRDSIPSPLPNGLKLDDLLQSLSPRTQRLEGFAYHGVAGVVANSFALRTLSSIELFGLLNPAGELHTICFGNRRPNNAGPADVAALADFAVTHRLLLVDWCRRSAIPPAVEEYRGYFSVD